MKRIKTTTLINAYDVLHNAVIVLDNQHRYLTHFKEEEFEGEIDEHWQGYACPGFVNAHCHLELSHLKNQIPEHTGLVNFILNVQSLRANPQNSDAAFVQSALENAEAEMLRDGIVAVGDISNTSISFHQKSKKNLYYHTFLEALGFVPERADLAIEAMQKLKSELSAQNLQCSITAHAPYSVSQKLFQNIASQNEKIYSLHHLESVEEKKFLENKSGELLKLYESFNIDIEFFNADVSNSTEYWLPHFNVPKLILVHNTFMDDASYALITQALSETYFCLCPNANLFIENKLPDIPTLLKKTKNICLGTDSLASNHQLSIRAEIESIRKHFPEIDFTFLIQCATIKGAEALGIDEGKFKVGGQVNFLN